MDQSAQQDPAQQDNGTGQDTPAAPEATTAPARAPRKRRTASAPAGAPPAAEPTGDPAAGSPAPTRRRAARAPKADQTDTSQASTSQAASSQAPTSQTPSGTADAAPEAGSAPEAPARAPRTRRRAATAAAGPARTPDETATGRAAPADAPSLSEVSPAAGTTADDTTSDGAADGGAAEDAAPTKPTRTRRTSGRSRRDSTPTDTDTAQPGTAQPDTATTDDTQAQSDTAQSDTAQADTARPDSGTPAVADDDTPDEDGAEAAAGAGETSPGADPFSPPESPLSLLFHAPDLSAATVPSVKVAPPREEEPTDEDSDDQAPRSRRSRRGRSRGRSDTATPDAANDTANDSEDGDTEDGADTSADRSGGGTSSRRRRRRRRGDQDLELTGGEDDDPNTVTRVRAPRAANESVSDKVTSVRGSTRLEAKKQRRRESRDTGRRRQVITEAEFLARRESVDRQMIVRQSDDRIQIGVLEDGMLAEHFVSRTQQDSLIGNVYVGKVQNVLPSMEAAFIDIGRGRNAVLYAGEVNWDAAGLDGQPRRIELALKSGDPVLVQVTKDPVGHKGARLTSQISLPGRYLVYVPGGSMTGISRKLPDVERNRLKRILKDRLPENAGVIVRTAAEGASEEELTHDINRLRAQWEEIERKAGSTKTLAPELLYGEPDLTIKVVRDVFNEDFSKLVVSGEEAWDTIEAYVMYVAPDLVGRLEKWTGEEDIFSASRIDEQISKALERKVFLPSGGSLVIDRTEAMTVVDVNTGKFTGSGGNLEETVTKNNLEAAEEVVRQLRLRDIGGIIVIDFIDMVLEANRDLVLRRLVECLGRDRTKHQVAEVTSLGLVQMTRKRMGTGLLEVFGEECQHCEGRGVITHAEPVEHRHTPAPDTQQQGRQGMSRSERKRNRTKGPQQEEGSAQQAAPPAPESPERAAKAEAARAALASIAAATHHGHGDSAEDAARPAEIEVTEAVLTINGETLTLPRAERQQSEEPGESGAASTGLTLDSLSEAFEPPAQAPASPPAAGRDSSGEPADRTDDAPPRAAQPAGTPPSATGGRRPRGRRVARSAQGAADTAIDTDTGTGTGTAEGAEGTAGSRYVATAAPTVREPEEGGPEPLIFGVGVPASKL
ncbi:Rne/Rng family ribonuclease [uncultured Arthrobacter sp.]|uniref:Rne/Rng family ribonuclease n=1 Tax=uncultured Arthrobacter sp. TaxID=114050 RepID=UPI0026178B88|nr:Rne/Rng family ribonuclease [uncultured Arthrobacter sp.]